MYFTQRASFFFLPSLGCQVGWKEAKDWDIKRFFTTPLSTRLPWQSSFFILICLRIPKSEPTSNGLDCWRMAAKAENRLIWRARLVVGWSHLALNGLSKQDSLTAGRSVWHERPSLGHTAQPDSSQPRHFAPSQLSLCCGLRTTSGVTSGKPLEPSVDLRPINTRVVVSCWEKSSHYSFYLNKIFNGSIYLFPTPSVSQKPLLHKNCT